MPFRTSCLEPGRAIVQTGSLTSSAIQLSGCGIKVDGRGSIYYFLCSNVDAGRWEEFRRREHRLEGRDGFNSLFPPIQVCMVCLNPETTGTLSSSKGPATSTAAWR
jgi:hypothetical protein